MTTTVQKKIYGVIGAGSFGLAIANLVAENGEVLLYSRRADAVNAINATHRLVGIDISPKVRAINDLKVLADSCTLIFVISKSSIFREVIKELSPHLRPYHILIHGTKGLDSVAEIENRQTISRKHINTMSEVILQETSLLRVGCLSGPNLAKEIIQNQPTATVIASNFTEVIREGQAALRSHRFQVYGTHDLVGAELAGVLKNIIALGAGVLAGRGLGYNVWGLLIARGLAEMIHLGKALGADVKSFFGVAGIGDLVATAASKNSRNYMVGYRFSQGESLETILGDMSEVAEGLRTLKIMHGIANYYKIHSPITQGLYAVFFEKYTIDDAIDYLMNYPYSVDVDFI